MNPRSEPVPQKRFALGLALALIAAPATFAQTVPDMSHFEVSSVKLNDQDTGDFGKCHGGPGTQSPTLWICNRTNLVLLIQSAFGVEVYQFTPPDWMVRTFLSISARLPQGATKEQFHEMQRNLLVERFGFTWHWKESDATVYRMVRDAGGVKLRESGPDAAAAVVDYGRPSGTTLGKDRYPVLPEGVPGLVGLGNHNRWRSSNVTTADIAWVLRWEFRTEVRDETELTGHYDVDLRWETQPTETSPASPPFEGPDAKTEFRNQLGLRIEPAKGKIRTFVVDHVDRVPTEN